MSKECEEPVMSGGPLTSEYCLEDVHFHWARNNNNKGCEHEIDGKRFDVEIHMVHRRKECATNAEARNRVDGLCVLGVLVEVVQGVTSSPFLQHLMTSTQHARYKGEEYEDSEKKFNPYAILEDGELWKEYYTYEGCVTGPPFPECVRWIVFDKHIQVSREDLESLRNVFSVKNEPNVSSYYDAFMRGNECIVKETPKIGDNYMKCRNLSGRVVEKSF